MSTPPHTFRRQGTPPQGKNPGRQKGWGLTETLLTLGAVSVMAAAIYMALSPTGASAQVKIEQDNLRDLSRAVDRSFGLVGTYSGVSTNRVVNDKLAPERMLHGGDISTAWGERASVNPFTVNTPNDSFVVIYPGTPAEVCSRLSSAMGREVYQIRVNGSSVYQDGAFDPGLTASACSQDDATMEFIFYSGMASGTAVAAPVVLPPSAPTITPPPTSPPVITIPDAPDVDPVTPGTPATPPTAAPPTVLPLPPTPVPPPAAVLSPPPVSVPPPPPVTPPGVQCSVPASWTDYDYRTPNCAVNQFGRREQRRSQNVSYSCPEAWDNPVETRSAWSGWSDTLNTCTGCPAPSTQPATRWVATSGICPAGQYGVRTWEREQSRQRGVSYNCPAGTLTLPAPTYGTWTAWSDTFNTRSVVNSCTNCPTLSNETQTRWETVTIACPAGRAGSRSWEREQVRSRTRSYNCPAGTSSLPPISYGGWTGWSNTGATRNPIDGCAPMISEPCPDPQTETTYGSANLCSGNGYPNDGADLWGGSASYTATRTRSATCTPGGSTWTGSGWIDNPQVITWSSWTSWSRYYPPIGGCLCERVPAGASPGWPSGWIVYKSGSGTIYYECR